MTTLETENGTIMERTTFFEHYRICVKDDGSLQELSRSGAAITYKAVDVRSGDPVAIKMLSLANVESGTRDQLEAQAKGAQLLDHFNIARLHAFGIEDDHFVYVSEYSAGETVDSWIAAHGPMPPEAVLRISLQVVSALNAASFHGVRHRAIQPSNLIIVPGATADGGWPFVKLLNFGLDGVKPGADGDAAPEQNFSLALPFASPEQVQLGTVDFRSEIYSLAATMCFLLTGAIHSAESRQRNIRRFPKALRNLLAHMLRTNPDERPQDPIVFIEEIRDCLTRIERRQALSHRFGVPFAPIIPRPIEKPRPWLSRRTLAFAALMLLLGTLAAVFLPERIGRSFRRTDANEPIGVPVGVLEPSPSGIVQNTASSGASTSTLSPAPAKVTSAAPLQARSAAPNQTAASPPPAVASLDQTVVPPVFNQPATPPSSASSPALSNGSTAESVPAPSPVSNPPGESSPPAVATLNQATPPVVNQSIPPSSSTVANVDKTAPAITQSAAPSPTKVSPAPTSLVAAAPKSSPGQTAPANNAVSEPAPPAEAPEDVPAPLSDSTAQQDVPAITENDEGKVASRDATTTARSSNTQNKSTSRVVSKQPRRTKSAGRSANQARRNATATQWRHHQSRSFVSALPEGAGTFQARFLGTTPDGRWILGLPSGETTTVRPPPSRRYVREPLPRRLRRMIFGRPVVEPPPPAPMYPPDW